MRFYLNKTNQITIHLSVFFRMEGAFANRSEVPQDNEVLVPRWDQSKREEYVAELLSQGPSQEISAIGEGIRDGSMDLMVAAERIYEVMHAAAVKVFGVVGKPSLRLPSGRLVTDGLNIAKGAIISSNKP